MSTVPKAITLADYYARECAAQIKSEYYRGEMFAMAGGSRNHSLLAANFIGEVRQALKLRPCSVFTSDLRIKVDATGLYTYPDASIVCGDLEFDDDVPQTVVNPIVLVEVLSDSTESYYRGRKSSHYRQIPTLRELLLISQDEVSVERYIRQDTGGWLLHDLKDIHAMIPLESAGIEIAMSEIYRNVKPE